MKKIIMLFMVVATVNSFAMRPPEFPGSIPTDSDSFEKSSSLENIEDILNKAEDDASVSGRKILETSRQMIVDQEIILGSCWDFINAVYNRNGYTSNQRVTVYKSKQQGPYVVLNQIQGGDWLYFINHSYGNVEHSGVFVAWTDLAKSEALVMSYPGGNQAKPARYRKYDLRSVYNIIRPK